MRWWVSFAAFLGLSVSWALATPIFAAPDEPSHVIAAAAIADGQIIGNDDGPGPTVEVTVPRVYGQTTELPSCFAFKPDTTADCAPLPQNDGDALAPTYTARNFPPYSLMVGLGSIWYPPGSGQIYMMRFISAAIVAALLASCLTTLAGLGSTLARAGFLFGVTPAVLFFAGVVNPSGPEIAAGLAVWVHGGAMATGSGRVGVALIRRFGLAAAVLCATRPLSPMWLLLILLVLIVVAGMRRFRELLQERALRLWGAFVAAVALAQVIWIAVSQPLAASNTANPGVSQGVSATLRAVIGKSYWSTTREMIGVFGWLDTHVPQATVVLWIAVVGCLIVFAVAAASPRGLVGVGMTIAITYVVPIVIESVRASANGLVWHGRYTMPFAVGIPILAGMVCARGPTREAPWHFTRVAWVLGTVFVVAQVLAFAQAMRRYIVGANGRVWFFFGDTPWRTPLPAWTLLLAYTGLTVALAWIALRGVEARRADVTTSPAEAVDALGVAGHH